MDIYRFVCFFYFLFMDSQLNALSSNKRGLQLFMKKQKNSEPILYKPKTFNQENYVNYLNDNDNKIIISAGPAGSGKTLFACQKAILQMKSDEIHKIIITRPMVTVEEEIGFLPGNIIKKMDPWTKPIFDIFLEYCSKVELDLMLNNGKIEICPLAFMRGRTFKHSFIIADEMQNSSPNQMKMLTTRLGINSRIVITGDLNQTDIPKENGLYDFVNKIEKFNNTNMIKIIKLGNGDIERSDIVKQVIEIYDYKKPVVLPEKLDINNTTILKTNVTVSENNTSNSTTTQSNSKKSELIKYNDNDAALIPKQHITRNYDIFNQYMDF